MELVFYSHIIWGNSYENVWYAIERDSMLAFFNGNRNNAKYIQADTLELLKEKMLSL